MRKKKPGGIIMALFEKAVEFALKAHEGQKRKDGGIFFLHPMEVASIAGTMTQDENVIIAGILHDTVEDTDVTAEDILREFGPRIAELVASETEDKRPEMAASDSWQIRKEESLEFLADTKDEGIKMLWLSDKLSNIRALAREEAELGESIFNRFNEKNPVKQRWYFSTIAELTSSLSSQEAYNEYVSLVHRVFDKYAEDGGNLNV